MLPFNSIQYPYLCRQFVKGLILCTFILIQATPGFAETRFWHGSQQKPLLSVLTDGTKQLRIYRGGEVVALQAEPSAQSVSSAHSLTSDHLGSPRLVMDSQGTVSTVLDYAPYGEPGVISDAGSMASRVLMRFTGYDYDPDLAQHVSPMRLYETKVGRFLSRDPVSGGSSPYKYALDNPVNFIDPNGTAPIETSGLNWVETIGFEGSGGTLGALGMRIYSVSLDDTALVLPYDRQAPPGYDGAASRGYEPGVASMRQIPSGGEGGRYVSYAHAFEPSAQLSGIVTSPTFEATVAVMRESAGNPARMGVISANMRGSEGFRDNHILRRNAISVALEDMEMHLASRDYLHVVGVAQPSVPRSYMVSLMGSVRDAVEHSIVMQMRDGETISSGSARRLRRVDYALVEGQADSLISIGAYQRAFRRMVFGQSIELGGSVGSQPERGFMVSDFSRTMQPIEPLVGGTGVNRFPGLLGEGGSRGFPGQSISTRRRAETIRTTRGAVENAGMGAGAEYRW